MVCNLYRRVPSTIQNKPFFTLHKQLIIFALQNQQNMDNQNDNWKLTPEKAHKMLTEEGMNVSLDEAAEILSLLRILAECTVKNYLKGSENDEIEKVDQVHQNIETTIKSKPKKNDSAKGIIYCKTCNFLNDNF